jgi:hypothetical protein
MTLKQRLALVVMDERDGFGDEAGLPDDSLVPELTASVLAAQTARIYRIERQLDALNALPEIVAMLARAERSRTYK